MGTLQSFLTACMPDVDTALLRHLAGQRLDDQHLKGRTLRSHLLGTKRVLAAWGQSSAVQRAGLCHSLYSTEDGELCLVSLTERHRVRRLIGIQAEELVFLFCATQFSSFFRNVQNAPSLLPSVTIPIEIRKGFVAREVISGTLARDLLLLHMAHFAELAFGSDALMPWFSRFQSWVRILTEKAPDSIPAALVEVRGLDQYAELKALTSYLRAIRSNDNLDVATKALQEVTLLLPHVAEPHIWMSRLCSLTGDDSMRRYQASLAFEKLLAFGTTWDKRLLFDDWLTMARIAKKKSIVDRTFDPLVQIINAESRNNGKRFSSAIGNPESTIEAERSNFEEYLLNVGVSKSGRLSAFYPGLREDRFWEADQFQLASSLRENFGDIRKEIDALSSAQFYDEAEGISRTGKWGIYILLEMGRWHHENLAKLPTLSRILKQAPELLVSAGQVYLSRLAPGTVVSAHSGPTNTRLRLHFGIQVPEGDCAVRVGGLERNWLEGESLILNDFWEHEVWNRTDEERLILLVDIWHPDISPRDKRLLESVHWMVQQRGRGLHEYWKKNEAIRREVGIAASLGNPSLDDLVI